jgi:peptidoglycan hydrolase-like protein with peptidoglycan-binding domain
MRFRAIIAVLAITPIFIAPAIASAFTLSRTLCFGDAGTAVANLQQFLLDNGDNTLSVTSYFGLVTQTAVKEFQTSQGLTTTGCTGPLTRARITTIESQHPDWLTTLSNTNGYTNVSGAQVHSPAYSSHGVPAGATAQCKDGTYSFSLHHSGTCSHHGGVATWLQ